MTRGVVGLTGGIACGKSTAAALLRQWGARHCDVDAVGHALWQPNSVAMAQAIATFGPTIVASDGSLDRKCLAAIVFSAPQARLALNAIAHPPMVATVKEQVAQWASEDPSPAGVFVIDAALLFEMQLHDLCEETLAITASSAVQIDRLMSVRGLTLAQAQARLDAQRSPQDWQRLVTTVFDNSGSLNEFTAQLAAWWRLSGGNCASAGH